MPFSGSKKYTLTSWFQQVTSKFQNEYQFYLNIHMIWCISSIQSTHCSNYMNYDRAVLKDV